jgi:hypothetical protein
MKKTYVFLYLFILFIFCEKQPNESLQTKEELAAHIVSHEHSISFSGTILNFFATGFTDLLDQYILKDVEGIKIIYQTVDQNNHTLEASGMLMIPKGFEGNGPLVSLQHGTLKRRQ